MLISSFSMVTRSVMFSTIRRLASGSKPGQRLQRSLALVNTSDADPDADGFGQWLLTALGIKQLDYIKVGGEKQARFGTVRKETNTAACTRKLKPLPNCHIYLRLMIDGVVSQTFSGETLRPFDSA